MRRFLRRLAWFVLRLWLVAALAFSTIAKVTESPNGTADFSTDRLEESRLPLFFNPNPVDLASEVDSTIRELSISSTSVDAQKLQRLGAAAFPLLMPRLAALPNTARLRAAFALLPIARRMAWRGSMEIRSEPAALEYVLATWSERSVDFQPAMVARWVERLGTRGGAALAASVVEFDTFALPWLISALHDVEVHGDVPRAQRLVAVASHITSIPWTIADSSSPRQAQAVVEQWRRWWQLHSVEYTEIRGLSRWSTMLKQTKFGQWAALVFSHRFGTTRSQQPIVDQLAARAPRSIALLLSGMIGALMAALTGLSRFRKPHRWWWLSAASVVLASIPHVSIIALLAFSGLPHSMGVASFATTVATFVVALDATPAAALHANRADTQPGTPLRVGRILYWSFAGYVWPFLLTLVLVVELAFGIQGLGEATVTAFRQSDLHMLMAIATLTTVALLTLEFVGQVNRPASHEEQSTASRT